MEVLDYSAHPVAWGIYIFFIGACVGSFLNVVIYRLPAGKSLIKPGSHCPVCNTPIKPWHNIPIFGWLLLRGRCANCDEKISARYPLIELLTALLFYACLLRFGLTVDSFIFMALCALLVTITFIDIDHYIIPDKITLPGIPIGFLASYFYLPATWQEAGAGFIVGFGLFWIILLIVPHGFGGGDVKLMGMLGAFLGLKSVFITIFLGSLIGSVVGVGSIIFLGKDRKAKIPFGPYLAAAAIAAIFWEEQIVNLYIDMVIR